ASSVRSTPSDFDIEWAVGHFGQVSDLVSGKDQGWRVTVKLSAILSGSPADLRVDTAASVQDFRRYDILGGGALHLAAQCTSHYSSVDHTVSNLFCHAPVGSGTVSVNGNIAGVFSSHTYDLALIAKQVPIQSLTALARHSKKDLPD